jgi:thioesterase domain-containing protein
MQVAVVSLDADSLVLSAPLEPNRNPHGTVFGGSAATLAVLAAASLLHTKLDAEGIACQVVVHRSSMEYLAPLHGPFSARAFLSETTDWARFTQSLRSRGKARARVTAVLSCGGVEAARFQGQFVGLREGGAGAG